MKLALWIAGGVVFAWLCIAFVQADIGWLSAAMSPAWENAHRLGALVFLMLGAFVGLICAAAQDGVCDCSLTH